jgi:hypothetical protein
VHSRCLFELPFVPLGGHTQPPIRSGSSNYAQASCFGCFQSCSVPPHFFELLFQRAITHNELIGTLNPPAAQTDSQSLHFRLPGSPVQVECLSPLPDPALVRIHCLRHLRGKKSVFPCLLLEEGKVTSQDLFHIIQNQIHQRIIPLQSARNCFPQKSAPKSQNPKHATKAFPKSLSQNSRLGCSTYLLSPH